LDFAKFKQKSIRGTSRVGAVHDINFEITVRDKEPRIRVIHAEKGEEVEGGEIRYLPICG
jgi:hypothetical protein